MIRGDCKSGHKLNCRRNTVSNTQEQDSRPIVVCLHGSASNGGQWRTFRKALRGRCRVFTPDLVGYGSRRFRANSIFSLQNEVDAILEQIGDITEPFHLIGHSYGGAVAIFLAKSYPERIKSLIVYEPANFAVLFAEGLHTEAAREILEVRATFANGSGTALSRWRAARSFISYWSGAKAWRNFKFSQRSWLASVSPKVAAEFNAIAAAQDVLADLSDLSMPVKIICGTRTRLAAKRVCELMARQIKYSSLLKLVNLKHMAPLTDPHSVNPLLVDFVVPPVVANATSAGRRSA
jgi:pimeloyl-ACP methyl ester carboxylesterase